METKENDRGQREAKAQLNSIKDMVKALRRDKTIKYKYTAVAIKWFDKINGNTYHSVRIVDNETGKILYCPFQYGYDDHYRQTAIEAMAKAGWIPERYEAKPYLYERENEYPIYWIVNYGLKRECISNGREE